MKLKTHFVFPGNCEEAFNLYKELFNGEITFLFRKKQYENLEIPEEEKEKISHMVLQTKHFELAGEDAPLGQEVISGNNNKLVLVFDNVEELQQVFHSLAEGGKVVQPLEKTFFCEAIGEVVDRFGIYWIVMMTEEEYMKEN